MKKEEKRKIKEKDRGIVDFIRLQQHFWKDLNIWINEMADPRNPSYITYTQADLVFMGILKNVCAQESMREMDENFNEETCIDTLSQISGDRTLKEMPHYDTLNYYLERLSPQCLADLRAKMMASLIRSKQFYRNRLLGKYWRVVLDGTQLFCFKEKHCENCLRTTYTASDGRKETYYYHRVLEAKMLLGDKLVISLDTEFIENEKEDAEKQDCEINAAKRLLGRLKKSYPRLPVCIQGDCLYAVEPIMEICRKNGWKYIFTQKATRQKIAAESYEWIEAGGGKTEVKNICRENGTGAYINHVEEVAGKTEVMNLYEYEYEVKEKGGTKKIKFQWVSNIELTERKLEEMVAAGRGRWKIENEGFNNQKNGIYCIGHINSRNSTAMKNHYLLTQIADMIMQVYLAWNPLLRKIKQSIKNTSSKLLESFRSHLITNEDVQYIQKHTSVYLE